MTLEKKYHSWKRDKDSTSRLLEGEGIDEINRNSRLRNNTQSLDIYCGNTAAKTVLRLREVGLWRAKPYGHASISEPVEYIETPDGNGVHRSTNKLQSEILYQNFLAGRIGMKG